MPQNIALEGIISCFVFHFHEDGLIFRFHELSHTCASLLLSNGIPIKQIQIWLGHSTFSTTADIYAHLDFSAQEQSAAAMSGMFRRKEVPAE